MDWSDDFLVSIILVVYMLKYVNTDVVFQEIPNETTLAINISNCPCHCKGCHSSYLAEDIGEELTPEKVLELIDSNNGITCVAFMGGDSNPREVYTLSKVVQCMRPEIKRAWYSGRQYLPEFLTSSKLQRFSYIKLGPYIEELGGLKSPTTNQRLYEVKMCREVDEKGNPIYGLEDITNLFWK